MSKNTSKVTIHMVASLDRYIARRDNSVSWFQTTDRYDKGEDEEDPEEFMKTIDCFVMGSKTYELALELGWPYGNVPTYVLTHRNLPSDRKTVEFCSGDPNQIVNNQLKPNHKNIWMVGGAMLTREFIRLQLADDIRLSILPIILGDGLPFLNTLEQEQTLHLKDATAYKSGVVELWYEIRKK